MSEPRSRGEREVIRVLLTTRAQAIEFRTRAIAAVHAIVVSAPPTVAQQVALWWQSPICTAEGCTRSRRLENDHQLGWAETKRTRLDELDPLCEHEHDLKTYFGWALVAGTGKRPNVAPDDPRHPKYRAPRDP